MQTHGSIRGNTQDCLRLGLRMAKPHLETIYPTYDDVAARIFMWKKCSILSKYSSYYSNERRGITWYHWPKYLEENIYWSVLGNIKLSQNQCYKQDRVNLFGQLLAMELAKQIRKGRISKSLKNKMLHQRRKSLYRKVERNLVFIVTFFSWVYKNNEVS